MSRSNLPLDLSTLSAPERLLLAQQLVDSVLAEAMPLTPAQAAEVRSRAIAIDAGDVACDGWTQIHARLQRPE